MAIADKDRTRAYRHRMREGGLRPIQIWVADTRRETFADEARRQAQRAAQSDADSDIMDFVESVAAPWDE